jgi:serpin B
MPGRAAASSGICYARNFNGLENYFVLFSSIPLMDINLNGKEPDMKKRISARAADLRKGVTARDVRTDTELTGNSSSVHVADFAVSLFQKSAPGGRNTLVSPLSVLCALAMTANGAGEQTLAQMEQVFGMNIHELNEYLHAYLNSLPSDSKYKLSFANSIWLKDDSALKVEQDFLQANADYYGASVYKAAFDEKTLNNINGWVKDKTDCMIPDIIDSIPPDAVMYLINALAFNAQWADIYEESQISDGTFTTESGEKRDAEMMYGSENRYLEDQNSTGFIKYYADGKYAFAALLPNEGTTVNDFIASLTGETLLNMLENAQNTKVNTAIPKFSHEYSAELSDILKSMGMTYAFDPVNADFFRLGRSEGGNICISRIIHKTYIQVDEKGTMAGAATAVEMEATSAMIEEEIKTVYLNRPFVYMLVDTETNLPFFIGTMMDTAE